MKRSSIENSVRESFDQGKSWLQNKPIAGFLCGIGVGVLLVVFKSSLLPLLLLVAIVLAALWIFSEEDRPEDAQFREVTPKNASNGSGSDASHDA